MYAAPMKHRVVLLVTCGGMLAGGLLSQACSSTSKPSFMGPSDGGHDSSVGTNDGSVRDTGTGPLGDSSVQGMDVVTGQDSGAMMVTDSSVPGDGGGGFDGPLANCSPIMGACDIVSQNCGPGMECIAVLDPDGGPGEVTACSTVQASEHLPSGHSCCPSGTNPCDPGLECIGNACDLDAAAPATGRCTPHCCSGPDGGDDTPCGLSVPEGYPGHCDLTIVDNNNNSLYSVCTYSQNCKPFHVESCAPGSACLVQDNSGTATCSQIFNPAGDAGGLGQNQPCSFGNECADGLMCLISGDAGGSCLMLCYVQGQATPFDAGNLSGAGPGYGGCPVAQNCGSVDPSLFPAWLGLCQ